MSSSTVLCVFLIGLCVVSVQGLTLRLRGKEIIPNNGEVVITDLPVGGCRRFDTLECLSDVPYQGLFEKAYWKYTDPYTLEDHLVDDIHCKDDECESPDIGWQSSRGIYRKGSRYYNAVRLGRSFENAMQGVFTCLIEGDSNGPVSVNIVGIDITPAPTSPPPPPPPPLPDTTILPDPPVTETPIPSDLYDLFETTTVFFLPTSTPIPLFDKNI